MSGWYDEVLKLLGDIRSNGTPMGSTVTGLNFRIGDQDISNANPVPVSDGGGSVTVDGAVSVANFPAVQAVSGTLNIGNFPAVQQVNANVVFPAVQPVSGAVAVNNLPLVQTISGEVVIANLPSQRFTNYEDFGTAAAGVAKPSEGVVYSLCLHNHSTTTTRFFQLHNSATAPITGAIPTLYFPVCSGNSWIVSRDFFGDLGRLFPAGIAWGWSNTPKTFSAVQSPSEHSVFINYI